MTVDEKFEMLKVNAQYRPRIKEMEHDMASLMREMEKSEKAQGATPLSPRSSTKGFLPAKGDPVDAMLEAAM